MNSFFDDMDILLTMIDISDIFEEEPIESVEIVKFSVEEDWEDFIE